jgi:hypothetical protein
MLFTRIFRPHDHPAIMQRQNYSVIVTLKNFLFLFLHSLAGSIKRDNRPYVKCNTLVVSHFIGDNPTIDEKGRIEHDNYFGDIMHHANANTTSIAFLMHESKKKTTNVNVVRYFKLLYFFRALIFVLRYLIHAKQKDNRRSFVKNLKLFHSHDILDWMVAFSINDYAKKVNCQKVIFTFEGNIWENNLVEKLGKNNIKSIGYLHGPFRSGFLQKIKEGNFKLPDLILLKSEHELELFNKQFPRQKKRVVGSHRITPKDPSIYSKDIDLNKASFLFAPEGLECEVSNHFEFALLLRKSLPTSNIVFRFHPNYNSSRDVKKLLKAGVRLSNNTLEKDLFEADFCIYRGSTVCFQALSNDCIPLYLSLPADMNISPLKFLLFQDLPAVSGSDFMDSLEAFKGKNFALRLETLRNSINDYPASSQWSDFLTEELK